MKHSHRLGELLCNERYEIKSYLNEGGMQYVYIALDRAFNREVALKTPKDASALKRFKQSAALSAKITHPNVAKTLDYFDEGGSPYLIEELIDGADLGKQLEEKYYYFDPHLAAHIFYHIVKGVGASHHLNIIHRDLKPSNIMASTDNNIQHIKVTDFGIANMAKDEINKETANFAQTQSKTVLGALPYMAPEIVDPNSGFPITTSADIWSLGAILYQLLSGKHPFGSGLTAVLKIVKATTPPKPNLLAKKQQFQPLSNELWDIILSCLKQDPAERPTADELIEKCSRLCYSCSSREAGKVGLQGIGATWKIRSDSGEMVFSHESSYFGDDITSNTRVSFASHPGAPFKRASPVLPIK